VESAPVSRQFLSYEQDLAMRPPPQKDDLPYEEFAAEEDDEEETEDLPGQPVVAPIDPKPAVAPAPEGEAAQTAAPASSPSSQSVSDRRVPPPRMPTFRQRGNGLHILIRLPQTEEVEEDVRRMLELNEILKRHRGNDRISLLVQNGLVLTRLEPLERISYSDTFHQQVEDLLGEGTLQVREE
jgi:hypothetical protein